MELSPRWRTSSSSARRLFTERSPGRSHSGQARRKLALDQASDDPKREPNVVARLMGLESLPECPSKDEKQAPAMASSSNGAVQLQELLKIKEPLLLRELLRESEEQSQVRKPSLVEKFTGFVRRRGEESRLRKPSPPPVSPIKSPIKSKRGLMLEAAVKFLDVDLPEKPQSHHHEHNNMFISNNKKLNKKQNLSRSSSEPCLSTSSSSSSTSSQLKVKLSEFSKRLSSREPEAASKQERSKSLVRRSKSDVGLEKWSSSKNARKPEQDHHSNKQSRSGEEMETSSTSSSKSGMIGLLKLFRTRRATSGDGGQSDTSATSSSSSRCPNTTKPSSGEASSARVVRALLLRRKSSLTKPRQRSHETSPAASVHTLSDELTSSESCLQFSDEFSDDSSSSSSSRLEKSCQPSPVSVLQAAFVDDHTPAETSSCSSVEDSPDAVPREESLASTSAPNSSSDDILNAILDISRIRCLDLSAIGFNQYHSPCREKFIEEVLSTNRALWEQQTSTSGSDWYDEGLPISDESFTIMETRSSSGSIQGRKLMFHCVDEALDVKLRRSRSKKQIKSPEFVISQVQEQIQEWSSMASRTTDELVERDMSTGAGRWRDVEQEVEGIARDLERGLLRKMIEEVARELL